MGRYQQEFRRSLADPDQFWRDASALIDQDPLGEDPAQDHARHRRR